MWCPIFCASWEEAQKIGQVHTTQMSQPFFPPSTNILCGIIKQRMLVSSSVTGSPEALLLPLSQQGARKANKFSRKEVGHQRKLIRPQITDCTGSKSVGFLIYATQLFRGLHWCPACFWMHFKVQPVPFKALHDWGPGYSRAHLLSVRTPKTSYFPQVLYFATHTMSITCWG